MGDGGQTVLTGFQTTKRFLKRFLERGADGHHFTHGLHLRGEAIVGLRELFKGKTRHLRDNVVNGRFDGSRLGAARHVVLQFVEGVAHGKLGGNLGDREASCLGSQSGRTGHARVHFNDDQATVFRIDRKLHVGTTGSHTDLTDHGKRGIAQLQVFLVRQGLSRSHRDGVTRVDTHRVQVFDRANDDAVVVLVTDHFHFDFLPTEKRLFNQ